MESANMTLVTAILVVGLLVGAGVGYYMAPETVEVPSTPVAPIEEPSSSCPLIPIIVVLIIGCGGYYAVESGLIKFVD